MLEHAIGKTARGRADIGAIPSAQLNLPACQRGFQLESAPADVALFFPQHPQNRSLLHRGAGLLHFLLVDQNPPGEDQRLRPFP